VKDGVDLLLDLDVQGAAQVRLRFPDAVSVFILPPSFEALERRLRGRGAGDERSTEQRLRAAAEELPLYKEYDYTVINDDLERTVENLKAVVRAARCRTALVEGDADRILGTFPGR
jgi:guanylate kinase